MHRANCHHKGATETGPACVQGKTQAFPMPTAPTTYSRPPIKLHGITAALVIAQFVAHESIAGA